MKKTFCYVCSVIICMSMLVMTSCKNTGAVKEAAEKAVQAGAIKLGPVGEATAMTVDEEALVCDITADTLFMSHWLPDIWLLNFFAPTQSYSTWCLTTNSA